MNTMPINYPLELNRREKRLAYFRTNLLKSNAPEKLREEIVSHLDKYSLLISKLYHSALEESKIQATSEQPVFKKEDPQQTWVDLWEVERQLNYCFSDARLLTAKEQHI